MMRAEDVYTHDAQIRWKPNVRFLEMRSEVLRGLESLDELSHLALDEGAVSVSLSGGLDVRVTTDEVAFARSSGPLDGRAREITSMLERVLDPAVSMVTCRSQHLLALSHLEYREATALAARTWLAAVPLSGDFFDSAVLADGYSPELRAAFQVEFGVVERSEIPPRFMRRLGRVQGHSHRPPQLDELPTVALFADMGWTATASQDEGRENGEWAWSVLERTIDRARSFVDDLMKALVGQQGTEENRKVAQ